MRWIELAVGKGLLSALLDVGNWGGRGRENEDGWAGANVSGSGSFRRGPWVWANSPGESHGSETSCATLMRRSKDWCQDSQDYGQHVWPHITLGFPLSIGKSRTLG